MESECRTFIRNHCCRFGETCDGREHYSENTKVSSKGKVTIGCYNQVLIHDNTPSPIQERAFYSLYLTKRRAGIASQQAWFESVVQTSDDVFAKADPEQIQEYEQMKKGGRNELQRL